MSSSTPNIGLTLPVGGENVSRQIINENNTKIDNYAGTLNSKLLKPVTVTVDPITNASGSYNHTTSGVTLITEDMKAIDIEVGTPETFKAPVTVTTGNHTVNVSCPSVSGSSTITITFIHTEPVEGGQNVPAQITSTEFDILAGRIGNLSSLQTSVKTDTVSAVNELSEQIGMLNSNLTALSTQVNNITSFSENVTIDSVTYTVIGLQFTAFNGRLFKIGISLATATSNRLFVYNGFLAKWETVTLTAIS